MRFVAVGNRCVANKQKATRLFFITILILSQFLPGDVLAAEQSLKVVVVDLKGQVEIVKKAAPGSARAVKGMELNPGDTVKAGKESWAKIEIENLGAIELEAETTWFYDRSVTDQGKHAFEAQLAVGRLKAKVKKLPEGSLLEIKTPTSIVAVRGTIFSLLVYMIQKQIFSFLEVSENSVEFSNLRRDQKLVVREGQSAAADESGKLTPGAKPPQKKEESKKADGGPPGGGPSDGDEKSPFDGYPPGVDKFMGGNSTTPRRSPENMVYNRPGQGGESQGSSESSHDSGEGH